METLNLEQIEVWLKKYHIENYMIDPNTHHVHVKGHVFLMKKALPHLPIQFGEVTGDFNCSANFLNTLKGVPHIVGGNFDVSNNWLSNFEHAPLVVKGKFTAKHNKINQLNGLTPNLMHTLDLSYNQITQLGEIPKDILHLNLNANKLEQYHNSLFELTQLNSLIIFNKYENKFFHSNFLENAQVYLQNLKINYEKEKLFTIIKDKISHKIVKI